MLNNLPSDLPGPLSAAVLERLRAVLYPGIGEHLAPFVLDGKSGSTLVDLDGNEYVDCASASASVPLGAARADLIEPTVAALRRFGNEDGHAISTELAADLAERLLDLTPASLTRVAYALNGTEAIETAVKVMRRATGRPIVLGFLSAPPAAPSPMRASTSGACCWRLRSCSRSRCGRGCGRRATVL